MFNKKKETQQEISCPWNQRNGYVCDYTFATRLFAFLTRNYETLSKLHPIELEEYEYLVRCAAELKTWQMSVPSDLNHQYFENLKNVKTSDDIKKYLKAIGSLDAYDVEKHLAEKPDTVSANTYDNRGVFVAVNENGDFHLFLQCPQRTQDMRIVEDLSTWEEDHYGKPHHPEKWDGTYVNYWMDWDWRNCKIDEGLLIEPEKLPAAVQSMTWEDEPIKII